MANPWFRLWGDMVNDPKFGTIARVAKQEKSRVLSVYLHMMTLASSATKRGHTEGWNDEDIATALDIDTQDVTTIREAMQGRLLDGDYLTGWEKRQPKREREDEATSTARVQEFRAKKHHETPCNANDNQETPRGEEIREEEIKIKTKSKTESANATRLPADWSPSADDLQFCIANRPDLESAVTAARFKDYWIAQPGAKGRKTDWAATWRNWVRNEKQQARASPAKPEKFDPTAYVNRKKPKANDERTIEIDQHGEPI